MSTYLPIRCKASALALAVMAVLLLAGCGGEDAPERVPTEESSQADLASTEKDTEPVATEESVEVDSTTTRIEESWFVRTIAPLGDERGLCFDLAGWTPTNINFDAPVHSHTCKHGWWNMDGRFDRAGLVEGRLEMPFFERCLEATSLQLGSNFFVKPCDGGQRQQYRHLETGQIVLGGNPELCITVPDEPHRDAGGDDFWLNGLILDTCADGSADRQRWAFTEPL